jgi:hypothetical protein
MPSHIVAELIKSVTQLHQDMKWVKKFLWIVVASSASTTVMLLKVLLTR